MTISVKDKAMLGRHNSLVHADWNGTVEERVREYLSLSPAERENCFLETMTPVRYRDDRPPSIHLRADMIQELAGRLFGQLALPTPKNGSAFTQDDAVVSEIHPDRPSRRTRERALVRSRRRTRAPSRK